MDLELFQLLDLNEERSDEVYGNHVAALSEQIVSHHAEMKTYGKEKRQNKAIPNKKDVHGIIQKSERVLNDFHNEVICWILTWLDSKNVASIYCLNIYLLTC